MSNGDIYIRRSSGAGWVEADSNTFSSVDAAIDFGEKNYAKRGFRYLIREVARGNDKDLYESKK